MAVFTSISSESGAAKGERGRGRGHQDAYLIELKHPPHPSLSLPSTARGAIYQAFTSNSFTGGGLCGDQEKPLPLVGVVATLEDSRWSGEEEGSHPVKIKNKQGDNLTPKILVLRM